MKGQVSTELLVIIALVLLVFIPLLVMVYFKANEANQQIASYQAELAVFRLAYLSNSVGSLGTNTTVYTDVFVPKNVQTFETRRTGNGGEIVMKVDTPQGPTEIVEIVRYPVSEIQLADQTTNGIWIRMKISSVYVANNPPMISIQKVSSGTQ